VLGEAAHGICEQANAVKGVLRNQGHVGIPVELPLAGGKSNGYAMAHALRTNHAESFNLAKVRFAWRDGAARPLVRQQEIIQTGSGNTAHQTIVFDHFYQRGSQHFQAGMQGRQGFLRCRGRKQVVCLHQW
jgi:hypothetical protein